MVPVSPEIMPPIRMADKSFRVNGSTVAKPDIALPSANINRNNDTEAPMAYRYFLSVTLRAVNKEPRNDARNDARKDIINTSMLMYCSGIMFLNVSVAKITKESKAMAMLINAPAAIIIGERGITVSVALREDDDCVRDIVIDLLKMKFYFAGIAFWLRPLFVRYENNA